MKNKLISNKNVNYSFLLENALILKNFGLKEKAAEAFIKLLTFYPNDLLALNSYCEICIQLGNFDEALKSIKNAINNQPKNYILYNNQGTILNNLIKHKDALNSFDNALLINSNYAVAYLNRGYTNFKLLNNIDAIRDYEKAISIQQDFPEAYNGMGNVYRAENKYDKAIVNYSKATALRIDYFQAYDNLGQVYADINDHDNALFFYQKALDINYKFTNSHYNRGVSLYELNLINEAIIAYDTCINLDSNHLQAIWNKSICLLLLGYLYEGFLLYESRWKNSKSDSYKERRFFSKPTWHGNISILGKTILIYTEQGLGDAIQFCRYIKLLNSLGAYVIIEIQANLFNLFKNLDSEFQLIIRGQLLPPFDYQCPILSLPLAFKTKLNSVPYFDQYFKDNYVNIKKWASIIGSHGFKIGIAWQGSNKTGIDIGRSFPLALFESISKISKVRLISLQKNDGIDQILNINSDVNIETIPADFDVDGAFIDTAAIIKNLDLVISCDSSLSHLAGAFGVQTWLPLKYLPDWRWMLNRQDSPWYPKHRLFRQKNKGDWTTVFDEMEIELRRILANKGFHNE